VDVDQLPAPTLPPPVAPSVPNLTAQPPSLPSMPVLPAEPPVDRSPVTPLDAAPAAGTPRRSAARPRAGRIWAIAAIGIVAAALVVGATFVVEQLGGSDEPANDPVVEQTPEPVVDRSPAELFDTTRDLVDGVNERTPDQELLDEVLYGP
jgi:hypothetical protein